MASAHVRQPIVLNDDNFSWQSQSRTVHTQVLFRLARYLTPIYSPTASGKDRGAAECSTGIARNS